MSPPLYISYFFTESKLCTHKWRFIQGNHRQMTKETLLGFLIEFSIASACESREIYSTFNEKISQHEFKVDFGFILSTRS